MLLPGVSRFAWLVASVRGAANRRLWERLHGLLMPGQRAALDELLTVPAEERVSELDRLRRGPVRVSWLRMKVALEWAQEIARLGMGEVDVAGVPPRRPAELSRNGVDGKVSLLRRHAEAAPGYLRRRGRPASRPESRPPGRGRRAPPPAPRRLPGRRPVIARFLARVTGVRVPPRSRSGRSPRRRRVRRRAPRIPAGRRAAPRRRGRLRPAGR